MKNIAVCFFICGLVAGCASAGNERVRNETNETVAQKIFKGSSTKDDVRKLYGDPSSTSFTDSGNEIWYYMYAVATNKLFGLTDVDKNLIMFFIDKKGVVQNYTVSRSLSEVRRGLAAVQH